MNEKDIVIVKGLFIVAVLLNILSVGICIILLVTSCKKDIKCSLKIEKPVVNFFGNESSDCNDFEEDEESVIVDKNEPGYDFKFESLQKDHKPMGKILPKPSVCETNKNSKKK